MAFMSKEPGNGATMTRLCLMPKVNAETPTATRKRGTGSGCQYRDTGAAD